MTSPIEITAAHAGSASQFRIRGSWRRPGAPELGVRREGKS